MLIDLSSDGGGHCKVVKMFKVHITKLLQNIVVNVFGVFISEPSIDSSGSHN